MRKILIVEDDEDLAELISFNLGRQGYDVAIARSGSEALNKARSILPDLILLDLMLPELDGMSVCEILRCLPSTATIPILILTAWKSEDSRALGLRVGTNDYLTKPVSPRELVSLVNTLLHERFPSEPPDSLN